MDDLTTEQFKVLVIALEHFNKTVGKEQKEIIKNTHDGNTEKTTYRIMINNGK